MTLKREGTLSQLVLESIQESIRDGEFRPGEALPSERELAERYGVGKSSIREAVKMLQVLGVVETAQGRGTYLRRSVGPQILRPLLLDMMLLRTSADELYEFRLFFDRAYVRGAEPRAARVAPGRGGVRPQFPSRDTRGDGQRVHHQDGRDDNGALPPAHDQEQRDARRDGARKSRKDTRNILLRQNGRPRRSRREIYERLPPHARRFRGREGTARRVNRRKRCKNGEERETRMRFPFFCAAARSLRDCADTRRGTAVWREARNSALFFQRVHVIIVSHRRMPQCFFTKNLP